MVGVQRGNPGEAGVLSWRQSTAKHTGGQDDLASSRSHYTCEQLLAASRPFPARNDGVRDGTGNVRVALVSASSGKLTPTRDPSPPLRRIGLPHWGTPKSRSQGPKGRAILE